MLFIMVSQIGNYFDLQEGAELLGGEKLGDTRQMTKVKAKPASSSTKRTNTMAKTLEEGKFS